MLLLVMRMDGEGEGKLGKCDVMAAVEELVEEDSNEVINSKEKSENELKMSSDANDKQCEATGDEEPMEDDEVRVVRDKKKSSKVKHFV